MPDEQADRQALERSGDPAPEQADGQADARAGEPVRKPEGERVVVRAEDSVREPGSERAAGLVRDSEGEQVVVRAGEPVRESVRAAGPVRESEGEQVAAQAGDSAAEQERERADGQTGEPSPDRASFRLAAFAAVIIVVLFAGYGIGRLSNSAERVQATSAVTSNGPGQGRAGSGQGQTGPGQGPTEAAAPHDDTGAPPHQHNTDGAVAQVAATGAAAGSVGGLAVTSAGLTLVPEATSLGAGRSQPYRFRIAGAGGAPITTYAVVHEKPLHFVLVRRDLTRFQHLHPTMAPDGTWSVDLDLAVAGSYRAIADFTAVVGGRQTPVTLGVDLTVAGDYRPAALPAPVTRATTDGFVVSYAGTPQTTATQPLLMTVTGPDGKPATLEPYLGAFGHLVVLREGDVGYVHVHPEPRPVDGAVKFWLAAPGPGRYRMFFDFQVAGKVHTTAFTAIVR